MFDNEVLFDYEVLIPDDEEDDHKDDDDGDEDPDDDGDQHARLRPLLRRHKLKTLQVKFEWMSAQYQSRA